jgi:hypothetical protein
MDKQIVFLPFSPPTREHTMNSTASRLNPFAMMLDPEAVISAMEDSLNLRRLRQRICRPLDKPLIPKTHGMDRLIQREFDMVIDTEEFMDSGTELYSQAQPALHAVH